MHWDLFLPLCSLPWKTISNSNGVKKSRQKDAINSSHNKSDIKPIVVVYKGRSLKGLNLFNLCWQLQVAVHGLEAECRREHGASTLGPGCIPGRHRPLCCCGELFGRLSFKSPCCRQLMVSLLCCSLAISCIPQGKPALAALQSVSRSGACWKIRSKQNFKIQLLLRS